MFILLDQWAEEGGWAWSELHVTLEFLFRTRDRAKKFRQWLWPRLAQRYRRTKVKVDVHKPDGTVVRKWCPNRLGNCLNSAYGTTRRHRVTAFACYAHKKSKITNQGGCCRLELRGKGTRWVRRLMQPAGMKRPRDLLKLDHRQFWKQWLKLFDVDLIALGRQLSRRGRSNQRRISKWGYDYDERAGALAARVAWDHIGSNTPFIISAQAVQHVGEWLEWVNPRYALRPVDNTPFLPCREGVPNGYGAHCVIPPSASNHPDHITT
jgi:hypothetical protein